jgi:hypothetical protein
VPAFRLTVGQKFGDSRSARRKIRRGKSLTSNNLLSSILTPLSVDVALPDLQLLLVYRLEPPSDPVSQR